MSAVLDKQAFINEAEDILEDDGAYGSNVEILNYSIASDSITGKFKDSWSGRVFEFEITRNDISYKPAINKDSLNFDSERQLAEYFDSYSNGYNSQVRSDGKLTGKRTKKPKCGNTAYGCGFSCIGLQKTCRIVGNTGKKARTNQGSAIGKERLTKLMDLAVKLAGAGDRKGFAGANAVAAKIATARDKFAGAGRERMSQRQLEAKKAARQKETKRSSNAQEPQRSQTPSIKTQKEFESALFNTYNTEDLVPIHKIRQTFGGDINKKQFDEWLLQMQENDTIQLMAGDTQSMSKQEREGSLTIGNTSRHLVKFLDNKPSISQNTAVNSFQKREIEPVVDQEIFKTQFPSKEIQRKYGLGGVIDRAEEVVSILKDPKRFTRQSPESQAGFLENIVTIHGVADKNHEERLNVPAVRDNEERRMGVQAANIRAQGAKQIWDNLSLQEKTDIAKVLSKNRSSLADSGEKFENKYVNQLASEIRKLTK